MSEPYSDNTTSALGTGREPTDDEYAAVAALIVAHAIDDEDQQQLVDAILGPLVTTKEFTGEHTPAHYMAGCRHPDCIRANSIYQRARLAGRIPKYQEGEQ